MPCTVPSKCPTSPLRYPSPARSARHHRILRQINLSSPASVVQGDCPGPGSPWQLKQQGARSQIAWQWPWAAQGLRMTGALQGHSAWQEVGCEPCAPDSSSSRTPAHWLLCSALPGSALQPRGATSGLHPGQHVGGPQPGEVVSAMALPWSSPETPTAPQALQPSEAALLGVHLLLPDAPAGSAHGDCVQSWARAC